MLNGFDEASLRSRIGQCSVEGMNLTRRSVIHAEEVGLGHTPDDVLALVRL